MKHLITSLIVGGIAVILSAGTAMAAGHAKRQVYQQKRIAQGVRSGELTRAETRGLQRNATRVHRSIARDRRDQGTFTRRERAVAQKRLNRQSRAIYRQKHDR